MATQQVMTLMFDARLRDMAAQLALMQCGQLDRESLETLHAQTTRLLTGLPDHGGPSTDLYTQTYGLPQETHEG